MDLECETLDCLAAKTCNFLLNYIHKTFLGCILYSALVNFQNRNPASRFCLFQWDAIKMFKLANLRNTFQWNARTLLTRRRHTVAKNASTRLCAYKHAHMIHKLCYRLLYMRTKVGRILMCANQCVLRMLQLICEIWRAPKIVMWWWSNKERVLQLFCIFLLTIFLIDTIDTKFLRLNF